MLKKYEIIENINFQAILWTRLKRIEFVRFFFYFFSLLCFYYSSINKSIVYSSSRNCSILKTFFPLWIFLFPSNLSMKFHRSLSALFLSLSILLSMKRSAIQSEFLKYFLNWWSSDSSIVLTHSLSLSGSRFLSEETDL